MEYRCYYLRAVRSHFSLCVPTHFFSSSLCGYPPFYADSQPALFEKIIHARYDFPDPEWSYVSDTGVYRSLSLSLPLTRSRSHTLSAKDFIRTLLQLESKKRLTTEQCLEHPFLVRDSVYSYLTLYNTSIRLVLPIRKSLVFRIPSRSMEQRERKKAARSRITKFLAIACICRWVEYITT